MEHISPLHTGALSKSTKIGKLKSIKVNSNSICSLAQLGSRLCSAGCRLPPALSIPYLVLNSVSQTTLTLPSTSACFKVFGRFLEHQKINCKLCHCDLLYLTLYLVALHPTPNTSQLLHYALCITHMPASTPNKFPTIP